MYMTKTARKGKWVIGTVLFVLLTNVFAPVRFIPAMLTLGLETSLWAPMEYSTLHGDFQIQQDGIIVKSYPWSIVSLYFNDYKACRPTSPDTVLYRLYTLKPYQFWDYLNYFIRPQWRLPYLPPDQIQPPLNPRPPSICPESTPDHPLR